MADDQSKALDDIRDSVRSLSNDLRGIREFFDRQRQIQKNLLIVAAVTVPLTVFPVFIVVLVILLQK